MRLKYRARRIDAYVSAALRLVDAGEADTALWFAEVAADACPGREDAAFALMRAQAASGQRVQAMETYRLCAKHLAEELGIDRAIACGKCTASCSMGKSRCKSRSNETIG